MRTTDRRRDAAVAEVKAGGGESQGTPPWSPPPPFCIYFVHNHMHENDA